MYQNYIIVHRHTFAAEVGFITHEGRDELTIQNLDTCVLYYVQC